MIKDSGTRHEFESGAVRDIQEGKGRCDLMPLRVVGSLYAWQFGDIGKVVNHIADFQETGHAQHLEKALAAFLHRSNWNGWADMFLDVAKHFEEGARKYGEHNWQKGIPAHSYVDSAMRHYLKWLRGDPDERHDRAFAWNIMCCIWTISVKPELNDYAGGEK